jgi:hypothetical protein
MGNAMGDFVFAYSVLIKFPERYLSLGISELDGTTLNKFRYLLRLKS